VLLQVPHDFLREVVDFELPSPGAYAVGTAFLEGDPDDVSKTRQHLEDLAQQEGLTVLGWRDVPVVPDLLGASARSVMPVFSQLFVAGAGASARRRCTSGRSAPAPCSTRAC
jgi:glutamate synthase (NADPH) large chain